MNGKAALLCMYLAEVEEKPNTPEVSSLGSGPCLATNQ